jgi:hypothetical protein
VEELHMNLWNNGVGSVVLGRRDGREFTARITDVRYVRERLFATMTVIHGSDRGKAIVLCEDSIGSGKTREYTDLQLRLKG